MLELNGNLAYFDEHGVPMSLHGNAFITFPGSDYVDLVPYQYGREFCEPGHTFGPAQRSHYLFHYIISGKGTLVAESDHKSPITHELHGGQGFMIFPRQICTYVADAKEPWVYTWVEFDGLRVKETLECIGLTQSSPVHEAQTEELRALLENELLFLSLHADAPVLQLIGHLYLFLDALVRSSIPAHASAASAYPDARVRSAIELMEQSYQSSVTVADVARSVGLNKSYFGKVFKEQTGRTPQQYLIALRMARATELLKMTSLSVAEVGTEVGYPDQLLFSRAFKNVYGLSPRAWRKQNSKLV